MKKNSKIKLSKNSYFVILIFVILKFLNIGRSTFRRFKFLPPPKFIIFKIWKIIKIAKIDNFWNCLSIRYSAVLAILPQSVFLHSIIPNFVSHPIEILFAMCTVILYRLNKTKQRHHWPPVAALLYFPPAFSRIIWINWNRTFQTNWCNTIPWLLWYHFYTKSIQTANIFLD